LVDEMQLMIDL